MNAAVELDREVLAVRETRDFRSYQAFLRAARTHMEGALVAQMRDSYDAQLAAAGRSEPETAPEAAAMLERLPEFQLYCWYYRHLQRFKYSRPDLGIVDTVNRERERVIRVLDETAAQAGPALRLDPALEPPEYFRMVDFHQHPGGVAHDPLDGLVYEIGRRTTVPQHADPNGIYRLLFDALPKERRYARVLDWGTGHGQALITWQQLHPESECHGVDLSAPCLKLAHRRAVEHGFRFHLSQQDLERLDYPDAHFDLVFFNFMLHELPPSHTPALLREVARVLKPGGLFAGHEFHLRPGDAFQNVLQRSHAWTNNETYSVPWYSTPIEAIARDAGFSKTRVEPFERLIKSIPRTGRRAVSNSWWNLYVFEK
ncbi:MAG: class I SAM-dependent methyltransferase [Steroidobacteraceae bacterium]|jgi:ubiquinone/menaquinone biosynthesis C-methylase UbiE|nr:class I SAM-dependent methyltransferase [Steroidobacteraceae bacterium]